MKRSLFARWRVYFFTGLAVVLPIAVSIALLLWLFGTIAKFTDILLFFIPRHITHSAEGMGPVRREWSLFALVLAVFLIGLIGRLARHYVGRKLIELVDNLFLRVPLLNKIYATVKQVNEAFSSKKSSFKQVVLVEFPQPGQYSIGFITAEQHPEVRRKTQVEVVSVFVPTTPNLTTGFLILQPKSKVTKLDMSVAEAIKLVISLGAIVPEDLPKLQHPKPELQEQPKQLPSAVS